MTWGKNGCMQIRIKRALSPSSVKLWDQGRFATGFHLNEGKRRREREKKKGNIKNANKLLNLKCIWGFIMILGVLKSVETSRDLKIVFLKTIHFCLLSTKFSSERYAVVLPLILLIPFLLPFQCPVD